MKLTCDARYSGESERDSLAKTVSEFVRNDEVDALCSKGLVLNYQRDMPALDEFLREMLELDSLMRF